MAKKSERAVAVKEERAIIAFEDSAWFQRLINSARHAMDEYNTAKTELGSQLKWVEIETKHKIGELIAKSEEKANLKEIVELAAEKLGLSQRVVYQCVQVYKAFPKISDIPEGKSIGWTRLVNVHVKEGGVDPKECKHTKYRVIRVKICNECGRRETIEEDVEEDDSDR